jgi:hypothetical protein
LGGKNSNENSRVPRSSMSLIVGPATCRGYPGTGPTTAHAVR